jgi:hypothetical protein
MALDGHVRGAEELELRQLAVDGGGEDLARARAVELEPVFGPAAGRVQVTNCLARSCVKLATVLMPSRSSSGSASGPSAPSCRSRPG